MERLTFLLLDFLSFCLVEMLREEVCFALEPDLVLAVAVLILAFKLAFLTARLFF